jgi:SAM-dependent methyltransferase
MQSSTRNLCHASKCRTETDSSVGGLSRRDEGNKSVIPADCVPRSETETVIELTEGKTTMDDLRSCSPQFVKNFVWNWKHRNHSIDSSKCSTDVLRILSTLEPHSRLLDLGCGTGNLLAALRNRDWKGYFIGVDVSERAIKQAKQYKDLNAEWHIGAIEDFRSILPKVDAICMCESIYYAKITDVSHLLGECRKSLLPSGRIIIRIWNAINHKEYVELLSVLGAQSIPPIYILR